jgi:hypothetical protein
MAEKDLPDDESIPNDEFLYVRIFPDPASIQPIELGIGYRPSSGSLKRNGQALSVDLGSLSTPEQTRDRDTNFPFHVAAFTAGTARLAGCKVVRASEPDNPAHGLVIGNHERGDGSLNKGQIRKISRQATIVLVNPLAIGSNAT